MIRYLAPLFILFALPAAAQEYGRAPLLDTSVRGDMVVSPGKVERSFAPGTEETVFISIANRTGEEQEFVLSVEDTEGTDDGSEAVVLLGEARGPHSIQELLSVPEEGIVVPHGERVEVPVLISVPEYAEPGGRYGSVIVSMLPRTPAGSGASVVARAGSLFFITVEGETVREGGLVEVRTAQGSVVEAGPVTLAVSFRNTGSVHLNPYGEVRVRDMFGREVAFREIAPWFALPDSLRFREIQVGEGLGIGWYTATVSLNRGYADIVDVQEVSFAVLPWKVLLLVFAAVFSVAVIMSVLIRRR